MPNLPHDEERFQPFVTTQWTMVLAAAGNDAETSSAARMALETLCETYWYPMYAFARRKGCSPELSEDLVQGFFAQLLRLESLTRVSPERGRFRSFLLASFQKYISDNYARSKALKRGGDCAHISLDATAAENRYALEPKDSRTPSELFDRQWALTLLEDTLAQLSVSFVSEGKSEFFKASRDLLLGDHQKETYAQMADRLEMTEASFKMAVMRMRRRYRELLTQKIRDTVDSADDVADELSHLLSAIG